VEFAPAGPAAKLWSSVKVLLEVGAEGGCVAGAEWEEVKIASSSRSATTFAVVSACEHT
jgi:hypothetical protein